jgi:hypothetical protein
MNNLMTRYGVTTERSLLHAIAQEYTRETPERHTIRDAELMLDGMLEAEYQRIEGGAYDELFPVSLLQGYVGWDGRIHYAPRRVIRPGLWNFLKLVARAHVATTEMFALVPTSVGAGHHLRGRNWLR